MVDAEVTSIPPQASLAGRQSPLVAAYRAFASEADPLVTLGIPSLRQGVEGSDPSRSPFRCRDSLS